MTDQHDTDSAEAARVPRELRSAALADEWLAATHALSTPAQRAKGNSTRARRGDLERWARVLDEVIDRPAREATAPIVEELTHEHVAAAIALAGRLWAPPTVRRMVSTLRSWCRWLQFTEELLVDPFAGPLAPASYEETLSPPQRSIAPAKVDAMLAAAATPAPGRSTMYWPIRDVALFTFMARTGARADEICNARIDELDLDTDPCMWHVRHAKGGKHREIPFGPGTAALLEAWLDERARVLPPPANRRGLADRYLFVRKDGSQLSTQTLDRLVRALARRAHVTLPPGAAAHAFRHSLGLELARHGVAVTAIQRLLGHADPRTAAIYTDWAGAELAGELSDAGLLR